MKNSGERSSSYAVVRRVPADIRKKMSRTLVDSRKASAALAVAFMILLAPLTTLVVFPPQNAFATFPGTAGKIAFMSDRDGNSEIYVMNANGTGVSRLTDNTFVDQYPRWSPDGTKIAFDTNRDTVGDIYVMNADGSGQTDLTDSPAFDRAPAWSPDGNKIAFTSDRIANDEIYVMDADGTDVIMLTNHTGSDNLADWSPDGTKIAFVSTRSGSTDVYVMNADGTEVTNISNHTASDSIPSWSPDGTTIAFMSDRDGSPDIYVMNADGTGVTRLTTDPGFDTIPRWSPDGTKIIFSSDRDGGFDIYIMNADGTSQTNLTNDGGLDLHGDFGSIAPPTISFDQATYSVSEFPVITVTDTLADTDPDAVNSVLIRVYSDSDAVGLNDVLLEETGTNTSVFVGNISLSTSSSSAYLLVKNGDTITAEYTHTDTYGNFEDITATADIVDSSDNTPPTGSITINRDAEITNTPSNTVNVSCDDNSGSGCGIILLEFANNDADISDGPDEIAFQVFSDTDFIEQTLMAEETGGATGIFVLELQLTDGVPGGTIEWVEGDEITVTGVFFDTAEGTKTVSATFRDNDGNSVVHSDDIILNHPAYTFVRQFGTSSHDYPTSIVLDSTGIYTAGYTGGSLEGTSAGNNDAFIRQYSLDGSSVLWTEQFGTPSFDELHGVAVDSTGVYAVGHTAGALEGANAGSSDAFVRKYSLDGMTVLWTEQFGTAGSDFAREVAVDSTGLYVVGGPFIHKFSLSGGPALWKEALGYDDAHAVAVDSTGVYVAGVTSGGGFDAFVSKYSLSGGPALWTDQFGTPSFDQALGLAVDSTGVYVVGFTAGALEGANAGLTDAFIRQYSLDGSSVLWTDQFGTSGDERSFAVGLDSTGVYVVGATFGSLAGTLGSADSFVRKYSLDGSTIELTEQYGTMAIDAGFAVASSSAGVFVLGNTEGSLEGSNAGLADIYLARFEPGATTLLDDIYPNHPALSDLVSWWPAEGNANDRIDGNSGTLDGTGFATGKVGNAFSFDGVNDSIDFGPAGNLNFGTSDFTISFWIQTSAVDSQQTIIAKRPICNLESFWYVFLVSNGHIGAGINQDTTTTNQNGLGSTTSVNDGEFHHVAVVRSGVTLSIYIDGVLESSQSTAGITNISNSVNVVAGESACTGVDGTEFFDGILDEVAIHTRAFTDLEVSASYSAGNSVIINSGDDFTYSTSGTASLSCSDEGSGCTHYKTSTDGVFDTETFELITTSTSVTFPPGDGIKIVKVIFKDGAGNESPEASDTIILDTVVPAISNVTDSPDPFSPDADAIDDESTISFTSDEAGSYTVMILTDSTAVQNLTGTLIEGVNNAVWDGLNYLSSPAPDGTYEYFILAVDAAGNERPTPTPDGTITLTTSSSTPTESKIAFNSDRDGNREIYVMNVDGTGQTRLTDNGDTDQDPSWSPDGTKIAFYSSRNGPHEIFVMNADGSGQASLSTGVTPDWSPDGTKIAFARGAEIYIMNPDGTNQTRLTNNTSVDTNPSWSPDSTKIAFRSDRDGNLEIYLMNPDGTNQTRLTNNIGGDDDPDWSPDGTKIAFASSVDGNTDIYLMNPDGTGQTRLTSSANPDTHPSWSPDGTKITFATGGGTANEIYIMNADGTNQIRLTNNLFSDFNPAFGLAAAADTTPPILSAISDSPDPFSPNGDGLRDNTTITFTSNEAGTFTLQILNATFQGGKNITGTLIAGVNSIVWDGSGFAEAIVPDGLYQYLIEADDALGNRGYGALPLGSRTITVDTSAAGTSAIAFASTRDDPFSEIYVMNYDGTGQTRLTDNSGFDGEPVWSPDGTKIAFNSNRDGDFEIFVMNADGSNQTNISNNAVHDLYLDWSPDGTKIAFARDLYSIFVMNADGSNVVLLSDSTDGQDYQPSWSPDGTKIAFASDRVGGGNFEIFVMNADGTGVTRLTNGASDDSRPDWSPDGTKIVFESRRDDPNSDIYVMNADGTGVTRLTNNPSFDYNPAWSPDGNRIAFATQRDGNNEIYVMNPDGSDPTNISNNVGNDESPSWSPILTATAISINVSDTNPPWGVDVFTNITVSGAQAGDYVVVSQGNGETLNYPAFTEITDGSLELTVFAYNTTEIGETFDVSATLFDSSDSVLATSNIVQVTPDKRNATLTLKLPSSVVNGTVFTASGDLADQITGFGLSNRSISFTTIPGISLGSVVTRGIQVFDGSGVEIISCPVPQCTHENPNASTVNLLELDAGVGAAINLPSRVTAMALTLQNMSGTVTVKVTRSDGSSYDATSDPAGMGLATFVLSARDSTHPTQFLESIEILSTSAGEPFATSKIELYDADADPTTLVSATFDLLPAGSYGVSLTIKPGAYYSSALSPVLVLPEIPVTAQFAGDSLYHPAEAELAFATELGFSLGETGIGGTVAIYANANPSFTVLSCSAADPDSDGDGLCDSWEDSAAGVPYACGADTCFFALPSTKVPGTEIVQTMSKDHKDIFVEIDAMDGQAPLDGALRRVIDSFGAAPIDNPDRVPGVTLHIIKDQMNLPFVGALGGDGTLFNAWVDPVVGGDDGNKANDYFGIKSMNYGTTDEERTDPALKNARANAIRYSLWVSSIGDSTTSGLGEDLGNDMIVSLGNFNGELNAYGSKTGTETEQAATFMHEMGHLFNLKHGGPAEIITRIGGIQDDDATVPSGGARGSYPRETTLGGYTLTTMGPGSGTIKLQQVVKFSGDVSIGSLAVAEDPLADAKLGVPTISEDGASTATSKIFNIHYPFTVPYTSPVESIDYAIDFGTSKTKYLRAGSSTAFDVTTQDFSVFGMLYRSNDSGLVENIVRKQSGTGVGYQVAINTNDRLVAFIRDSSGATTVTSGTVSTNTWYAWGASFARNQVTSVWLYELSTGDLISTSNIQLRPNTIENTQIFTVARYSGGGGSYFPGQMDNLNVLIGTAITEAQFTEFATTGTIAGLTPTSKYDFNGRNTEDVIGVNDLTANGSPTFPPNTVNPSVDNTVSEMSLGSLKINFNVGTNVDIVGFGTPAYPSVTEIIPEDNSMNCKPNYQSILSYSRQMDGYLNMEGEHLLDFSRGNYAPLAETSLDEGFGLFSRDVLGYPYNVVIYGSPGGLADEDKFEKAQGYGPGVFVKEIDWDVSGITDSASRANINNLSITGCNVGTEAEFDQITFYDYNDWNNIQLNWKENPLGTFDGVTKAAKKAAVEMTKQVDDDINKQVTKIQVDRLTKDKINYGETVGVAGSSSNPPESAVLSINWGDGNTEVFEGFVDPATGNWPISGLLSHTYGSDAIGERRIIAALLNSAGLVEASSSGTTVLILMDRTATSLTLTPAVLSETQQFTLAGTLSNLDHPGQGVSGRTITFTSSDPSMVIATASTDASGNFVQTATAGTVGSFEIVAHFELPTETEEEVVMLPSQSSPQTLVVGEISFSEVLSPIKPDGSSVFKQKSTVPIKFQLTDSAGNFITDAVATLRVVKITSLTTGTEEAAFFAGTADSGSLFVYDAETNEYHYNLGTKNMDDGTWGIRIYLNYGTPSQLLLDNDGDGYTVKIMLKQ